MDKLQKQRRALRSVLNKDIDSFYNFDENDNLELLFRSISDEVDQIFVLDQKIMDLLEGNDDVYETEVESTQTFRKVWLKCQQDYAEKCQVTREARKEPAKIEKILPKMKFVEYDLEPRNWNNFWTQMKRVEEDDTISDEDKFVYLSMSLKANSKARKLIDSFPNSAENYRKALNLLQRRFGRAELILDVLYRDLLKLVENKPSLTELYEQLSVKLRGLETLGISHDHLAFLIPLIEACLPYEQFKMWERKKVDRSENSFGSSSTLNSTLCNLDEFLLFLEIEVETEEKLKKAGKWSRTRRGDGRGEDSVQMATAAALVTTNPMRGIVSDSCVFCDSNSHASQNCKTNKGIDERREDVKRKNRCFICLRSGHRREMCKLRVDCNICKKRHFTIVCNERRVETASMHTATIRDRTVLKTLIITIDCNGKRYDLRAILDDGSHKSYIKYDVCEKIGLRSQGSVELKHLLFGGHTTAAVRHEVYKVKAGLLNLDLLGEREICGVLPTVNDSYLMGKLKKLGITLSDYGTAKPIEVLLGADVIPKILTGKVQCVTPDLIAIETVFGWCLLGDARTSGMREGDVATSTLNIVASLKNFTVPSLWELEPMGITQFQVEDREDHSLKHFLENVNFDNNRYTVALPWAECHPPLASNVEVSRKRLDRVVERLYKNGLYAAYDDVFRQWESEGIIERVPVEKLFDDNCHYLPHRPVVKESKTTKIRPVFDASAKTSTGVCLNECVESGPNLIQKILPLLVSFREGNFGLTGDIKQAFLQICLKNCDRDMLRFLWVRDNVLMIWRHCRVVFGVTCSPFLLSATIKNHLNSCKLDMNVDSVTIDKLERSFYVDDSVSSMDTLMEVEYFIKEAEALMKRGGFELRDWVWSGKEDAEEQSVLGLRWNPNTDEIGCFAMKDFKSVNNRKDLLSVIGRVYDPLGLLAAPMLTLKIVLQDVVMSKAQWSDPLSEDVKKQISQFTSELPLIKYISIPRCINGNGSTTLHIFSDASVRGLGCCIFARSIVNGIVSVMFVAAKARVCPPVKSTIPRKELLAANLGARFCAAVKKGLSRQDIASTYWVDSKVVLFWIKGNTAWKPYVGNRVREIKELTSPNDWRFCPGTLNPADRLSRGCSLNDYKNEKWWEGPSWLQEDPCKWPGNDVDLPDMSEAMIEKRVTLVNISEEERNTTSFDILAKICNNLSSYRKVVKTVAIIFRFISIKSKRVDQGIDLVHAEKVLIKYIQRTFLTVTDLETFCDEDNLIRVRTKILSEEFSHSFRSPILLNDCPMVEALVRERHEEMHHAVGSTLINILRETFWILKVRKLVRKVVSCCVRCRLFRSKPVVTKDVPLPEYRVKLGKVFESTGCDCAGPLFGKGNKKVWVVLFTCSVYRCVHLEIIDSLSSEAFALALRRFVARRGMVSVMISDNGTNFTGFNNALKTVRDGMINVPVMKWIFNVPTASWWGGFFERMIGVLKQLLRKTLGRAVLSLTELSTIVTEIEAVINARPITYCSDDDRELVPISPSCFLQEQTVIDVSFFDTAEEKLSARLKYIKSVRENLKIRFRNEYLGTLAQHQRKVSSDIQVGSVVWIGCDSRKRIEWDKGLVLELYPGKDGISRVAKLKTEKGELLRPVQRCFPLEASEYRLPSSVPKSTPDKTVIDNFGSNHFDSSHGFRDDNSDCEVAVHPATTPEEKLTGFITKRGRRVHKPTRLDL